MPEPRAHGLPSPAVCAMIVIAMLAMLAVPAAITLHTVRIPGPSIPVNQNATPHGYTWSLLLFIVPIVIIGGWFLPSEGLHIPQRAFLRTLGILVPLGFLLDFVFAQWFFCYPNLGATLHISAPALGPWVPVEEYVFYLTGFLVILLLYIWLGEFWLAAYSVPDYPAEARKMNRLLQFHPTSLILAVILVAAACAYKKYFALPADRAGFPGYFTLLVVGGLTPAVSFFPVAKRFINWRAFSLTFFFMLLVSLLWEATVAVPYNWWNYQHREMLGLFIGAWAGLPIEAVCVWIAVTYATVIVFEVAKIQIASAQPLRDTSPRRKGKGGTVTL
ncbi:MAG TPA: hypothetical protein VGG14_07370 [Candidatus Sulfotelmatobacter sp.]